MSVSHPFVPLPSQSPRPAGQTGAMHVPLLHVLVGALQTPPQRPQFAGSELRFTSQPFDPSPSQPAKPGRHAPSAHAPPEHIGAAFGKLHAMPHAPQLLTSDPVG